MYKRQELEGDENKTLDKYATTGSPEYEKMVDVIRERFGLSSLKFNTLETLFEAIGSVSDTHLLFAGRRGL